MLTEGRTMYPETVISEREIRQMDLDAALSNVRLVAGNVSRIIPEQARRITSNLVIAHLNMILLVREYRPERIIEDLTVIVDDMMNGDYIEAKHYLDRASKTLGGGEFERNSYYDEQTRAGLERLASSLPDTGPASIEDFPFRLEHNINLVNGMRAAVLV